MLSPQVCGNLLLSHTIPPSSSPTESKSLFFTSVSLLLSRIYCFHCFPIYLPRSDRTGCHHLRFGMLSFKPTVSLSSFTFIKRLFSSLLLSAIRMASFACLRLLIFLPAILIPACASSTPAFHTMYSAYKLNKHGDNIQP